MITHARIYGTKENPSLRFFGSRDKSLFSGRNNYTLSTKKHWRKAILQYQSFVPTCPVCRIASKGCLSRMSCLLTHPQGYVVGIRCSNCNGSLPFIVKVTIIDNRHPRQVLIFKVGPKLKLTIHNIYSALETARGTTTGGVVAG